MIYSIFHPATLIYFPMQSCRKIRDCDLKYLLFDNMVMLCWHNVLNQEISANILFIIPTSVFRNGLIVAAGTSSVKNAVSHCRYVFSKCSKQGVSASITEPAKARSAHTIIGKICAGHAFLIVRSA